MNYLKQQQQQQASDDQSSSSEETPIPIVNEDIISEILSRLPVKTILQFRSVSKPWLSLISHPSFNNLQFTHATTALFISAYDGSTRQRYLLSAPLDGGPVTPIFTPHARTITSKETTEIEHLNGLLLFTSGNGFIEHNFAYIVNPSTRKLFKLHGPASNPEFISYGKGHICYFFGFDQSRNEHKVLTIRMFKILSFKPFRPTEVEVLIFSLSSLSWRMINVDLPSDVVEDWNIGTKHSVCVNSVIHLILQNRNEILAFDLKTEEFSIIGLPRDAVQDAAVKSYCRKGLNTIISNQPFVMKINGFLGVVCANPVAAGVNEMDVWILKEYENRVWVRKTVCFSKSWFVLDGPFPLNSSIKNDRLRRMSTHVMNVCMYDVESERVKSVDFTLGYQFLHPGTVRFDHVRSYTESIFMPLPRNG